MLRCSPEAFAKCPDRHICGNIQEAVFMEGSECDLFNQSVMDKPMTNAERIRAMSDEELADWLARTQYADVTETCAILGVELPFVEETLRMTKAEHLAWLQQPAKEGA